MMCGSMEITLKENLKADELKALKDELTEAGAFNIGLYESPARIGMNLEIKYTDEITDILKDNDIIISGVADLFDHDGSGNFMIIKDKNGVREEDTVFLSSLSVDDLVAEIQRRGFSVKLSAEN